MVRENSFIDKIFNKIYNSLYRYIFLDFLTQRQILDRSKSGAFWSTHTIYYPMILTTYQDSHYTDINFRYSSIDSYIKYLNIIKKIYNTLHMFYTPLFQNLVQQYFVDNKEIISNYLYNKYSIYSIRDDDKVYKTDRKSVV